MTGLRFRVILLLCVNAELSDGFCISVVVCLGCLRPSCPTFYDHNLSTKRSIQSAKLLLLLLLPCRRLCSVDVLVLQLHLLYVGRHMCTLNDK